MCVRVKSSISEWVEETIEDGVSTNECCCYPPVALLACSRKLAWSLSVLLDRSIINGVNWSCQSFGLLLLASMSFHGFSAPQVATVLNSSLLSKSCVSLNGLVWGINASKWGLNRIVKAEWELVEWFGSESGNQGKYGVGGPIEKQEESERSNERCL